MKYPNQPSEKILDSLDGLKRAQAPDFFYSRLLARMENESRPAHRDTIRLRPALLAACLLALLVMNLVTLKQRPGTIRQQDNSGIEAFVTDYQPDVYSTYNTIQ